MQKSVLLCLTPAKQGIIHERSYVQGFKIVSCSTVEVQNKQIL